jgi:hypothetical protein
VNSRGEFNSRIREETTQISMIIDTVSLNSINDQLQDNISKNSAARVKVNEK